MPQMKPMNWLFLFIILNLILLFLNILNYFYFLKFNYFMNTLNKKKFLNWKW